MGKIIHDGIQYSGTEPHNYSTNEQIVGTWVDGSTLYERTFDKSTVSLPDQSWTNNLLGTSGVVIQEVSGFFLAYSNTKFPYNYYRSGSEYITWSLNSDGSDINVRPNMGASDIKGGYITIRYTKTST